MYKLNTYQLVTETRPRLIQLIKDMATLLRESESEEEERQILCNLEAITFVLKERLYRR